MAIRLAKTAGFCMGVRRAVNMALKTVHDRGGRIFTCGPLIHNRQALDLLRTKGIERLPDEPPSGGNVPVLIRAHGITPDLRRSLFERGFDVIDATCPHVARAQRIVEREAQKGRWVVIVGDRGHAEVEGLLGYARGRGVVVERPEDVEALPAELGPISVVAQTTQGGDRFERCVEALEARFGEIEVFNTRCNDTNNRQTELFEMADEVEAIVVVGGRGSANTRRLAELAAARGVPTWHVETADELPLDELGKFEEIGVTAGASTPHWIIEQVVERLQAMQRRRKSLALRLGHTLARLLATGQLLLASGSAAMALAAARLMDIPPRLSYCALPFLYLWAMHLLHLYATLPRDASLVSGPMRSFVAHRRWALVAGVGSLVAALAVSAAMGPMPFVLVGFSTFLGAVYSFGKIPRRWLPRVRFRRLHEIPGSKDFCVALAAAMMIAIVPWVEARGLGGFGWNEVFSLALTCAIVFGLMLVRSVAADLRQLESDLLLGRETLPVYAGRERTTKLMASVLGGLFVLALGAELLGAPLVRSRILLPPIALMAFIYWLTYKQKVRSHLLWEFLLDLPFFVPGALSFV